MSNDTQLPGPARPGDVVDGKVMTESGRWIPLTEQATSAHYGGRGPRSGNRSFLGRIGRRILDFGIVRIVVTLVVLATTWAFLPGALSTAWNGWRSGAFDSTPALAQEEVDAIEFLGSEIWEGPRGPHYVLYLTADQIEREFVGATIEVSVLDADDAVIATAEGSVTIGKEYPAITVGRLEVVDGADPVKDGVSIQTSGTVHAGRADNPGLAIENIEFEESAGDQAAQVTVSSVEDSRAGRVTVVVRDADGAIVGAESKVTGRIAAGEEKLVDITMWGLEELPKNYTVDAVVMPF